MTRPFQIGKMYYRDSDRPVTPPASFLADKQSLRVPVMFRDGETNGLCNDCSGTGLYPASVRCPSCHGTGGSGKSKDRAPLTDAETQMRDQEYRPHSGNMPGYRFAADTEASRASRQTLADAYREYETRLTSSWRDTSPDVNWSSGAGSPARRFSNPEGGAKEGDPCMDDNKRAGTLQRTAAGDLVCVASGSEDSNRSVQDMMRDHQIRMAEETRLYENSVANAWRNPR